MLFRRESSKIYWYTNNLKSAEQSIQAGMFGKENTVKEGSIIVILGEAAGGIAGVGCGSWVAFFAIITAFVICSGLVTGDKEIWDLFNQYIVPFCIMPLMLIGVGIYLFVTRKK